jgi:polyhydroxyalkanoate synthase
MESLADWESTATAFPGSWWPYWIEWLSQQSGGWTAARVPGAKLGAIEDAPGSYVKAR